MKSFERAFISVMVLTVVGSVMLWLNGFYRLFPKIQLSALIVMVIVSAMLFVASVSTIAVRHRHDVPVWITILGGVLGLFFLCVYGLAYMASRIGGILS